MGVQAGASLYCSTTGVSFGPVFDTIDEADNFLDWHNERDGEDPRIMTEHDLQEKVNEWYADRHGQTKAVTQ